jgi:hypothetical protein
MITNGLVCLADGQAARQAACDMGISYLQSQVFHYHDTMPTPEGMPICRATFAPVAYEVPAAIAVVVDNALL